MATLDLGELASDKKINGVFHAFGFSIPVGKDGRRMWPKKFKHEMALKMKSGKLSKREVQKTCEVSEQTVYRWQKQLGSEIKARKKEMNPKFAEVVIDESCETPQLVKTQIELLWRGVQLKIGDDYPVERLALLVRHLGSAR